MYYVTKTYDHSLGLSACFRQHRATSHCRFLHGYALAFKLEFGCHTLDKNGWVIDFGGLKYVKQFLIDTFDHRLLIAEDDPYLQHLLDSVRFDGADILAQPIVVRAVGCEAFAEYVHTHVTAWLELEHSKDVLDRGMHVVSVEVREHTGNSAIYKGAKL